MLMLRHFVGELKGMRAMIVGRSNIVGKPMASLLLREHCTVTGRPFRVPRTCPASAGVPTS